MLTIDVGGNCDVNYGVHYDYDEYWSAHYILDGYAQCESSGVGWSLLGEWPVRVGDTVGRPSSTPGDNDRDYLGVRPPRPELVHMSHTPRRRRSEVQLP